MNFLVQAIITGLFTGAGQIVAKVLLSLGIGYVSYTGLNALVTMNEGQVLALLSTLPPVAVQMIGVLKLGTCVKIMFSAMLMRIVLVGVNNDTLTKMRVTGGGAS